jgi:hypothetical protein
MGADYPKRDPFFAHKFVRLLHKAAVASEIGRDAFSILVVVAHTEDAMRYRGPAKFWNSQLIETLGFAKWDQFDKARRKAIESGWLQYTGDGKRTSGEYFVVIPDGYEQVSDSPIEQNCTVVNPENGYERGYKDGYDRGMIEGIKRVQTGYEQGEPSIPSPIPIPFYSPGEEIQIPEKLNKPEVMRVAGLWFRHLELKDKPEKIPPPNSPQEQAWWSQIAKLGASKFVAQAEKAMAEGWVTLRELPEVATKAKLEQNGEWIQALNAARSYPQDYETRLRILGSDLFEALKRTGTARVANANEFELKTLSASFAEHLKDIRNGTPVSN